MRKFLLLCFFAGIGLKAISQTQPIKGSIIFNNGDSLSCLIYNDSDYKLLKNIRYFIQPDKKIIEVASRETKSVYLSNNKYFETHHINGEVFLLRCLLKGYYSLYMMADEVKPTTFYLLKNDGSLIHLYQTFKEMETNGVVNSKSNKEYVSHLKQAMSDCVVLYNDIDNVKFDTKDLTGITKKYNDLRSIGNETIVYSQKSQASFEKGILLGANLAKSNSKFGRRFGLTMSYRPRGISGNSAFYAGIFYSDDNYFSDPHDFSKSEYQFDVLFSYSYTFLKQKRINPYLFIGLSENIYSYYDIRDNKRFTSRYGEILNFGGGVDYKIRDFTLRIDLSTSVYYHNLMVGILF